MAILFVNNRCFDAYINISSPFQLPSPPNKLWKSAAALWVSFNLSLAPSRNALATLGTQSSRVLYLPLLHHLTNLAQAKSLNMTILAAECLFLLQPNSKFTNICRQATKITHHWSTPIRHHLPMMTSKTKNQMQIIQLQKFTNQFILSQLNKLKTAKTKTGNLRSLKWNKSMSSPLMIHQLKIGIKNLGNTTSMKTRKTKFLKMRKIQIMTDQNQTIFVTLKMFRWTDRQLKNQQSQKIFANSH